MNVDIDNNINSHMLENIPHQYLIEQTKEWMERSKQQTFPVHDVADSDIYGVLLFLSDRLFWTTNAMHSFAYSKQKRKHSLSKMRVTRWFFSDTKSSHQKVNQRMNLQQPRYCSFNGYAKGNQMFVCIVIECKIEGINYNIDSNEWKSIFQQSKMAEITPHS